jgi:peptidoglycan/LPS O-acetylase OafA/YrhL
MSDEPSRAAGGRAKKSLFAFPADKFPALTGIRAIAAYLVFFHHYTPSPAVLSAPVHDFLAEGHVGVSLF